MKIKTILFLVAAIIVLLLGSCSLLSEMSVRTRITQFQTDLNAENLSSIQDNFSSQCAVYDQLNTSAYWTGDNSIFDFGSRNFDITITNVSGSDAYGTMMYNSGGSGPVDIHFEMVDEGVKVGWKILKIWTGADDDVQQIKILSK